MPVPTCGPYGRYSLNSKALSSLEVGLNRTVLNEAVTGLQLARMSVSELTILSLFLALRLSRQEKGNQRW